MFARDSIVISGEQNYLNMGWENYERYCKREMDRVDKRISDMLWVCSKEIVEFTERKNIDAVVNAADPTLMGSNEPGVDKSIHDAVDAVSSDGTKFKDLIRRQLDGNDKRSEKVFRCERGKAVVTLGGNFCHYVIHAVGSIYDGDLNHWPLCSSSRVNILESCYVEIVNILKRYPDIKSVVIPIIGSGNYGFPPRLAIRIAIAAVGNALVNWKEKDPELFNVASLEEIVFCIYDTDEKELQYSMTAHLRYMAEIIRYDSLRGYFAIAWFFRFYYTMEDEFMRAKPVTADEQYRLIMECRSSGLTDYQWCIEHDIRPGTFYNWVKRLRQKGCVDVPPAGKNKQPFKHEVVKIDFQVQVNIWKPACKL